MCCAEADRRELAIEGWTPGRLRLDGGLPRDIPINFRPGMVAAAGGGAVDATNPVCAWSFGIVEGARYWPARGFGTGPKRDHGAKPALLPPKRVTRSAASVPHGEQGVFRRNASPWQNSNPLSISPPPDRPRHAHQEIADLLAAASLRLRRFARSVRNAIETAGAFALVARSGVHVTAGNEKSQPRCAADRVGTGRQRSFPASGAGGGVEASQLQRGGYGYLSPLDAGTSGIGPVRRPSDASHAGLPSRWVRGRSATPARSRPRSAQ